MVATGAIAAFTTVGASFYSQNLTIALTFFIVSFPSVGVWMLFGSLLKRWLQHGKARQWFNYTMALLLVISVLPVVTELLTQLG